MSLAVTLLVGLAIAFVVSVGLVAGLDAYAAVMLGFILAFGWLAVAVARRSRGGAIVPARCRNCGGMMSRNAPYCKHCGARLKQGGGRAGGGSARTPGED